MTELTDEEIAALILAAEEEDGQLLLPFPEFDLPRWGTPVRSASHHD